MLVDRYQTSVSIQLLSAVLIVSSTVTLVTTGAQLALNYRQEVQDLNEDLSFIQKGYSGDITHSLWEMNDTQIQVALKGILNLPGVKYIEISDGSKLLFTVGTPPNGEHVTRSFPLEYKKKDETIKLGQMTVVAGLDHIYAKLRKTLLFIFLTQLIKTTVVSILVLLIIRRLLIRHLISMTDYLRKLDLSRQSPDLLLQRQRRDDELDILVTAINRMKANLQQSYTKLSTFNQELEENVEERTRQLRDSQKIIIEQQNALVASAKMSALGEMAGGIAHEINNPLATIQGLTYLMNQLLKSEQVNKSELQNLLSSMTSLTERIAKIIQGLRTFSRDGSRDPLELISVGSLIEETLSFCIERFKAYEVALEIDPIVKELSIQGRRTELSQVLLNLLNNSFDAVSHEKEKWVRISGQEDSHSIEIRVTDSGPGIPEALREKLFQPFFTTKEPGKGTGLGLSISFGIMRTHQGELRLDEHAPHTSFVLRIPKQKVRVPKPITF